MDLLPDPGLQLFAFRVTTLIALPLGMVEVGVVRDIHPNLLSEELGVKGPSFVLGSRLESH